MSGQVPEEYKELMDRAVAFEQALDAVRDSAEALIDTIAPSTKALYEKNAVLERRLSDAADTIASLEADRGTWRDEAEAAQQHITALEQDRALLLAYIRANEAWRHHPHDDGLTDAADEALDALIDAGLLVENDDGD